MRWTITTAAWAVCLACVVVSAAQSSKKGAPPPKPPQTQARPQPDRQQEAARKAREEREEEERRDKEQRAKAAQAAEAERQARDQQERLSRDRDREIQEIKKKLAELTSGQQGDAGSIDDLYQRVERIQAEVKAMGSGDDSALINIVIVLVLASVALAVVALVMVAKMRRDHPTHRSHSGFSQPSGNFPVHAIGDQGAQTKAGTTARGGLVPPYEDSTQSHLSTQVSRFEGRLSQVEEQIERLGESPATRAGYSYPPPVPMGQSGGGGLVRLYAEVPDAEGVFANDSITSNKGTFSLYELQPSFDRRTATVTLSDGNDNHQRALQNHERLLLPVCEYADLPLLYHRRILVTQPGRAEMDQSGGGWRVTSKIRISFA